MELEYMNSDGSMHGSWSLCESWYES